MKSTAAVVASRGAALTIEQLDLDEPAPNEIAVRVAALASMDALRQVSPEVFSPHNATRSAAEIAALSSESLHALLDAANVAY